MASESLTFNLLANDKASRVFSRLGGNVDDTEGKFHKLGRGLLAVGKVAALGMAAGIGVGAVAMKKFVGDAEESRRVTRLTEAVIKSTGGAAKVTAKQVADLSTELSNKTGVDDELIQTGSNLLLTFKNVRNEVGKGADIFNRATEAAVDLSAAGFGSVESSSKMLGKALNDPIAGITALSRAGVTFTEQQKEQIKAMVESGDILGAQKKIMAEVQSQVGGAAAATGTATEKLRVVLGNLSEKIGEQLLPYIDKAATWLGQRLPGAAEAVSGFLRDKAIPAFQAFADFIANQIIPQIQSFVRWVRDDLMPAIRKLSDEVLPAAKDAFKQLGDSVRRVSETFATEGAKGPKKYGDMVTTMVNNIGPFIATAFKQMALNVAILTTAFEVLTANVRFFARVGANLLDNFLSVFLRVAAGILRGAANVADALGMDSLAAKLRGAADKVEVFRWRVEATLGKVGAAGRRTGEELGAGLAAGIAASSGMAVEQARQTVNRINSIMRETAQVRSPSKVTIELGKDIMHGLGIGMKEGAKVALDAASGLVEQVKGKLSELRSQATQIRTSARDAVTGALDVGSLGAPGTEDTPAVSVTSQIGAFAAQAGQFAAALSAAASKGINSTLIAKVAAIGPTAGLTSAQALAALTAGEVASVNRDLALTEKFAAKIGQTVLTTTNLPADIRRQEKTLEVLKEIRGDLRRGGDININLRGLDDEDLIQSIRRYVRRNGLLRDVAQ